MKGNRHRRAITLIEVVVVIVVAMLLASLLLPAINRGGRSRETQCMNNLMQLAKAVITYQANSKGNSYPGFVQLESLDSPAGADFYPATPEPDIAVSWAAEILPHLDQRALWESVTGGAIDPTDPTTIPRQDYFICPSDVRVDGNYAHLSYIANTGAPDVGPSAECAWSDDAANGLMHNLLPGMNGPLVKAVEDGALTTILLSENVHKDESGDGGYVSTWLSSSAWAAANPQIAEQPFGMVWVYDAENWVRPKTQAPFNRDVEFDTQRYLFTHLGAKYARPASYHPGIFFVAMAGGNVRTVSEDIDYRVYQQLLTPNGAKCVWTLDPSVDLSKAAPAFRNLGQPLTDADF